MPTRVLVVSHFNDFISARSKAFIFIGLAKLDFQITIMTDISTPFLELFYEVGIEVIDFSCKKKFDKQEIRTLHDFMEERKIQIAHLFYSAATINGIRAAKGLPVKVVLYRGASANIHFLDPTAYFKYLHPRVDAIVCNSKGTEEYLKKNLLRKPNKAITISKGHKMEWYSDVQALDIREKLSIPQETTLVVNVANNRPIKGVKYLLEGFSQIPSEKPIHLLLIGRDMDNKENLDIITKGGMKDRVHILGHRKDVLEIEKSCDILVLASLGSESITRSVIEGMALGVAPIITNIPGNLPLVTHEENGLLVPVADADAIREAILRLYENEELRKKFGQRSKERIRTTLSNSETVKKYETFYKDLVTK